MRWFVLVDIRPCNTSLHLPNIIVVLQFVYFCLVKILFQVPYNEKENAPTQYVIDLPYKVVENIGNNDLGRES